MFHRLVFLILFFTSSLYCFNTKEAIKHTILNYNQLIINASKTDTSSKDFKDLKNFQKFASKHIAQKLYIWIKSWQESALFMDAKLLDINFTKVNVVNKEFAKVNTVEKWTYRYINGITKKEAYPDSNVTYNIDYQLINKNHSWIISKIEIISEIK